MICIGDTEYTDNTLSQGWLPWAELPIWVQFVDLEAGIEFIQRGYRRLIYTYD